MSSLRKRSEKNLTPHPPSLGGKGAHGVRLSTSNRLLILLPGLLMLFSPAAWAQDVSPLRDYHVWLPMTGVTEKQMDDAAGAGYDAIMLKLHPPITSGATDVDFSVHAGVIEQATSRGLKLVLAILGWVGLGNGEFWDVDESGEKIMNRLDPFHLEAMERVEWYFERVIDHYQQNPDVVAFAPTWGIYGEAGFTRLTGGRSEHAVARFNEWLASEDLPPLEVLPTKHGGPNTEFNRFVRFRYLYLEEKFDAMIRRLKERAGDVPVGMWQELYPVLGYLWTMVEVPSADFAMYESCFPFQSVHHPEKCLAETMGFRYRCSSPEDYRDYYLPLLARKRGEGQRFMGCQLSNHYAANYGWTEEKAREVRFDEWEDEFGPHLGRLLDGPLESPQRDVLFVFPTYAAAALIDSPVNSADTWLLDTLCRMYGCQMVRYGSPRLDKLSVKEMNRFHLIVVPNAAYLIPETYEKLKRTSAKVLFTGYCAQSFDAELTPFGNQRSVDDVTLRYLRRDGGEVKATTDHPLTRNIPGFLQKQPVKLPPDESFAYGDDARDVQVLLCCGEEPLLSTRYDGRMIFIHGQLFAGASHDPNRKPLGLAGSKDASANEHDPWGPYSSKSPQNELCRILVKNILDYAGVDYRVPDPKPRTVTPYLGDNMEQISISANIVYNNMGEERTLTVRTPYRPRGYQSKEMGGRYLTEVALPPFSYVALQWDE
jgi:hypothetical protein